MTLRLLRSHSGQVRSGRVFVSGIVFLVALFALYQVFIPLKRNVKDQVFSIERGQGSWKIAQLLQKEGFIRSANFFEMYAVLTNSTNKLQAGTYVISPALSTFQIVRKLASGDVVRKRITVIEGWTIQDIAEYLGQEKVVSGKDILAFQNQEGRLFPDTYELPPGVTAAEVITLMTDNFKKKAGNVSANELIMASILEKEVKTLQDKKIVSGILWKRLKTGIALQVDATITYITKAGKVSSADLAIDSPYNTYKRRGLPPTPISNPGLESIQAAVKPQESPYWYYLSTPKGETIFSRTLDEHNKAKQQFLR